MGSNVGNDRSLKLKAVFTTPVGVWPFQPPRSTGKLQTQAVSLPDERYEDASMTRGSSGAGDTLGNGRNDPSYSNVLQS